MLPLRRTVALRILSFALSGLLAGCATTVPYTGVGPYPQLERGKPSVLIDTLGNVLSVIPKVLFWNRNVDRHYISPATEEKLIEYLEARDFPVLKDAKFRLNQYRPGQDLSRLIHNRHVAWPYRLLLGLPVTLLSDVIFPGRIFGGDRYNPFTNTVHLYSDIPAISLHEAGHVHDLSKRKYKGTYAALRLLPGVDLYQEAQATGEAIHYLKETEDHSTELKAYTILYPAYGSYVGSYILPPIGTIAGVLIGHGVGRIEAANRARALEREAQTAPVSDPVPATP